MHRHRSNCFTKTLGIIRLPPSSTSFILILLINLASSEDPTVSDDLVERVNCRRVVFHPYCRGISAKRSLLQLQNGNTKPTVNTKTNSVEEFKPLNEWESIWNLMTEAQNLQRSAIEQQHQIIRSVLPRFISVGDVEKDHQNEEYQLIDADHTGDQRRDQQRHQLPPYLLNIPSIMIKTGNSRQARQQRLFPFPQHFQISPLFQHQNKITTNYLETKLKDELMATHVEIEDVSDGCGLKFVAKIVSEKFQGLPLLDQHRMVNEVLVDDMNQIHSFRMKTMTPEKFAETQKS